MLMQCVMVAAMGSIEELLKSIPGALTSLRQGVYDRFVKDRISKTMDTLRQAPISERAIALRKRHFLNTLTMTRWFKPPDKGHGDSQGYTDSNEMVDAVLNVVAKMDNVPSLKLIENARMMITHAETPVQLTDDCYLKLDKLDIETDGSLIRVRIILMSNTSSASELAAYVRRLQVAYRQELRNALGDTVYYFDQKDKTSMLDPRGVPDSGDDAAAKRARVMNAPRELSFTRTPFHSNKLFSNTFGEQVREVESRVRFFCESTGAGTQSGESHTNWASSSLVHQAVARPAPSERSPITPRGTSSMSTSPRSPPRHSSRTCCSQKGSPPSSIPTPARPRPSPFPSISACTCSRRSTPSGTSCSSDTRA